MSKGIHVDTLNGHLDHVHCLFELNPEVTLSKSLQLMKGEASFWANKEKLFAQKLDWADDYFAASVSESVLPQVRHYIKTQEEHHQKLTFMQEYEMFIKKLGLWKQK